MVLVSPSNYVSFRVISGQNLAKSTEKSLIYQFSAIFHVSEPLAEMALVAVRPYIQGN